MAIPTSIKTLLSGDVVEWARIELKQTWDPAASLKTICAFANDLDNWGRWIYYHWSAGSKWETHLSFKGCATRKVGFFSKKYFCEM